MFAKTLPTWTGLTPFITILWRCRPSYLGGEGFTTLLNMWQEVFPEAEILNSHSLQIILHETGEVGAAALNMITVPLLVGNPIFWACAMMVTFTCHGVLSFIHRCLDPADRAGLADYLRFPTSDTN
jgi:hypothetical protein